MTDQHTDHVPSDILELYHHGEVNEMVGVWIEQQLDACPECRARLQEIESDEKCYVEAMELGRLDARWEPIAQAISQTQPASQKWFHRIASQLRDSFRALLPVSLHPQRTIALKHAILVTVVVALIAAVAPPVALNYFSPDYRVRLPDIVFDNSTNANVLTDYDSKTEKLFIKVIEGDKSSWPS